MKLRNLKNYPMLRPDQGDRRYQTTRRSEQSAPGSSDLGQEGEQEMAQPNPSKYGLFGKLKAKTGKANELVSILLHAANLVSTAKGCHLYFVSKDTQNGDLNWVTEVWDSKEDHDNSLKTEGVRELISKAMPLIDGQPEQGVVLEVIGGKGTDGD
jgi:quinol monooxygenase YgiN